VLQENGVDLYTTKGKMMNCGGGGQCTYCKVDVQGDACGEQSPFEQRKFKSASSRLSCLTILEAGEATVTTATAK
jgi:ferredoxin